MEARSIGSTIRGLKAYCDSAIKLNLNTFMERIPSRKAQNHPKILKKSTKPSSDTYLKLSRSSKKLLPRRLSRRSFYSGHSESICCSSLPPGGAPLRNPYKSNTRTLPYGLKRNACKTSYKNTNRALAKAMKDLRLTRILQSDKDSQFALTSAY